MPQAVTNRVLLGVVRESTPGTTPATPKWLPLRFNSSSLASKPRTITSDEIVSSRMVSDLIVVAKDTDGNVETELSYHRGEYGGLGLLVESALGSVFTKTPEKDNAGTADSAITDVTATAITTTAVSPAWAQYMLIRATGFTNSGNNRIFAAATGSTSTSIAMTGGTIEAAPPGTARVKCIGLQGTSADLAASTVGSNCINSTALNFTNFGLAVGQWVRVGTVAGGDAYSYATAANNGWCRISAIAATKLTFDRVPTGWATDAGAGKTIRLFFGDYARNGTSVLTQSIEQQHPDLTSTVYQLYKGMAVDTMSLSLEQAAILRASFGLKGMSAVIGTTRFAGSTDGTAEAESVLNTSNNVGRIAENGAALVDPVYLLSMSLELANGVRQLPAVGTQDFVGVTEGRQQITGSARFYFGDTTILAKALAGTATALDFVATDAAGNTVLVDLPNVKFQTAQTPVPGLDQEIVVDTTYQALRYTPPTGSNYQIHWQRCELAGTAA